ncbi:hypothetical protein ACYSNM_00230 [Myroides sp. LJL116]
MKYIQEFSSIDFENDILVIDYKDHQIQNPVVQVFRLIDEFVYQIEYCKVYVSKAHNVDIFIKEPFKGKVILY